MDITKLTDAELQAEVKRREAEKKRLEQERQEKAAELNLQHIDALLALVPKHDRTSCSDTHICNGKGSASYGGCRCTRCFLLECKHDGYWPPHYEVEINLRVLKETAEPPL